MKTRILLFFYPVMSGELEFKKPVFLFDACSDVMNYIWGAVVVPLVAYNHDVRQVRWNHAGNDVSRYISLDAFIPIVPILVMNN